MMRDVQNPNMGHIGYEYREITVPRELASLCLDSYPCFGWEPDPNHKAEQAERSAWNIQEGRPAKKDMVTLYFRRNRSICNKAELTRLQRNFDGCISELQALEQSKNTSSLVAALTIGLIGTAFMAGSTFAVTADPPIIWLTILLAIPGLIGWIVPCFLYRSVLRKKTAEIDPLKEQKYDEIDRLCEKGHGLIH